MASSDDVSPGQHSSTFDRAAIIDDVYRGPTLIDVHDGLGEFCATVAEDDAFAKKLKALTGCDFLNVDDVTEDAIGKLYKNRTELAPPSDPQPAANEETPGRLDAAAVASAVTDLFNSFDQRYAQVETIRAQLAKRYEVVPFSSMQKLFDGKPFHLVLLDLFLTKGQGESEEVAKQVYAKFRSFIILMSNKPGAAGREEEFRRRSHLLRGFFHFCEKDELCDESRFAIRIDSLPKNHEVCHAIHDFVDAIDRAIGGPIPESASTQAAGEEHSEGGFALSQFMHDLRTLGLQDYAVLCETTLRDEGHPLGDYMMRLLGFHLIATLLADPRVRSSVATLDRMRFTEFLPFGEEASIAFKEMYANSLTERIVEPWSSHPWEVKVAELEMTANGPAQAGDGPESAAAQDEGSSGQEPAMAASPTETTFEIVQRLRFADDGKELPFLQLGDLLIGDDATHVYAVLSASCDLQFTPESVSKERPRERDDTVLLLPGRLRRMGEPVSPKARATTGLIEWNNAWYSIDWFPRKLLSVPHCILRMLFQDTGFKHEKRLQMGRAVEVQQAVLSWIARIGLDVQPPLPMDLGVEVYGKQADGGFLSIGEPVAKAAMIFHLRERAQPVLILRQGAFYEIRKRMDDHGRAVSAAPVNPQARGMAEKMTKAVEAFSTQMMGIRVPMSVPEKGDVKPIRLIDGSKKGSPVAQIGIRLGQSQETQVHRDIVFYLSVNIS